MKKQFAKLWVCSGVFLVVLLLVAVSALASEPLQAQMEVTPSSLTGPGTVRVSISVLNISDGGSPVSVTLMDPANNVCSGFGNGGTANLSPGQTAAYSGNWTVTQSQLDAGRITYNARYTFQNQSGQPVSVTMPITKPIKYNQAKAELNVDPNISPGTSVVSGQTVKFSYLLKNTGTIDITDITITDPDITGGKVTYPLLKVGESCELSYSFVAESTSKTSDPTFSYSYVQDGKTETKTTKMPSPTVISVTIPDVAVQLSAKQTVVNAGDKVDLVCVITNKSDLSYSQVKVTDAVLGDIDSGLTLGAGKSIEVPKSITVSRSQTYQFTVSAVDSSGAPVTFTSNSLEILTSEDAGAQGAVDKIPVDLTILVEADREIVYEQPSEVIFQIKVTNNGLTAVENVVVASIGPQNTTGKTLKTIESIAPGETVDILKAVRVSIAGQYQFSASAKDNTGQQETVSSNIVQLVYTPLPTPAPTPAPTPPPPMETQAIASPTQVSTTPFEDEEDGHMSVGTILLYALAGLLVVILLSVVFLFTMERRRRAPKAAQAGHGGGANVVIDSIQRSPHRDYARPPKRAPVPKREGKKRRAEPSAPVSSFAPADDVYEDDAPELPRFAREEAPPEDPESVYRRPKPAEARQDGGDFAGDSFDGQADSSGDTTEIYRRDYLARIRGDAREREKEVQPLPEEEHKKPMSEEEAALLSGSTGQYRLSRRSATLESRTRSAASPSVAAEDPEAFVRKQRAMRQKRGSLSGFYGDDEEEEEAPQTGRRRRR